MADMTETSAGATANQPFTVPVSCDAGLKALRSRIASTRWPDPEPVAGHSQGAQLGVSGR
jgi:hypothetical protein